MKILFLSHTYPPIVGGVETQNKELFQWLSQSADVTLVANRKRWLIPFFLLYAPVRALVTLRKYDVVLLGSCVLANVGWFIKLFSNIPVLAVAHGLDLTWHSPLYQKLWVRTFLPHIDKIIAVGKETVRVTCEKGIPQELVVFIPNGVDVEKYATAASRNALEKIIGERVAEKKVILTSGRLARRKGVAWFVTHVMSRLPENVLYVIAGSGPDAQHIAHAVHNAGLQKRVKILGYVSDEQRNILFATCDLFVQPNIRVAGDMEGFGISVLEAGAAGMVALASHLEGLKDAITDGENGFLVEAENADAWIKKITTVLSDDFNRVAFGRQARVYISENYHWRAIAQKYLCEIETTKEKVTNS